MDKNINSIRKLLICIFISLVLLMVALNFCYISKYNISSTMRIFSGLIFSFISILILVFIFIFYKKLEEKFNNNFNMLLKQFHIEQEKYKTIVEYSNCDIWEYNFSTNLITCPTITKFKPITIEEFEKLIFEKNYLKPSDSPQLLQSLYNIKNGHDNVFAEIRLRYKTKDYNWYELTSTTIYDFNKKPQAIIAKTVNINARKKELERLRVLTEYDPLTNLLKYSAFQDKVNSIIMSYPSNISNMLHAIIVIDIDNFNKVSNNLGINFSNGILANFANSINECMEEKNMAAYFGCNKFLVFLMDIKSKEYTLDFASIIQEKLNSIYLQERFLNLTCSIGISFFPYDGCDTETLFENADIALYTAKKNGKNRVVIYDPTQRTYINMSEYLCKSIKNPCIKPLYESHSVVDSDIVFNIIDMLFDAKNMDFAIDMAFILIANYYSLDQIGIYELNDDTFYRTYSWCSSEFQPYDNQIKTISKENAKKFALYQSSSTGVYATNSADQLDLRDCELKTLIQNSELKCIFQSGISEKGEYIGYFFANSLQKRDDWSANLVDTLTLLSRIIGSYIAKYRSELRMDQQIYLDSLTGRNNLKAFSLRAEEILKSNPNKKYVMIYIDIDKFKYINETYGYTTGDFILIELSKRLASVLTENETFGRIVDDKFVVLAEYINLEILTNRMRAFKNTMSSIKKNDIDNYNLFLTAGLYLVTNYENISSLIDCANIARKSIKKHGQCNYAFFNDAMKKRLLKQKDLENAMETALMNNEFCLFLQAKYNINTNKLCGAEALVRWNRPDYGIIPPKEFIPIFEENSFIIQLDYFIFEKVCQLLDRLIREGFEVVPISVNFSRLHLCNSMIVDFLRDMLNKYHLSANYLEIEITESALSEDDVYLPILYEIKELGFRLSMDDFGTGLSSLNSLRKLPFDIIKLDKDFFQRDQITDREKTVISNIVKLVKELEMDIIAEGVETEEQIAFLKEINCSYVQGYIFSKPEQTVKFIEKHFK